MRCAITGQSVYELCVNNRTFETSGSDGGTNEIEGLIQNCDLNRPQRVDLMQ